MHSRSNLQCVSETMLPHPGQTATWPAGNEVNPKPHRLQTFTSPGRRQLAPASCLLPLGAGSRAGSSGRPEGLMWAGSNMYREKHQKGKRCS